MELKSQIKMNKIAFFILILCVFTNCSKDSYDPNTSKYTYYFPSDEAQITASQIGNGTGKLDPKGIAIANNKLYICNGDVLEIFDATTLAYIKTITTYTKGTTSIALTNLTSISIDNGRIYLGGESRLFVFDETTTQAINTVGNGQWWQTFLGIYGVVVRDGLVFVKEQNATIKVFDTSQITETSNWNLAPIAKLNTLQGYKEIYSMDVSNGNLVVAGRNANAYLYYNLAGIRANAANSLVTPINPTVKAFPDAKPTAVTFSTDWAVTSEIVGNSNYLRLYPKRAFLDKIYNPIVNASDVMGANPFGAIVSTAQLDDRLFIADNSNQKIRIIKLNQSAIVEQR